MSLLFSALGLAVLVYRLGWRRADVPMAPDDGPSVSIVVPARNEEENLKTLLPSLLALSYREKEIVVVDDGSTDGTAQVATSLGVPVVLAGPKPEGWVGKNWACARGAEITGGELVLFTDADTSHSIDGLSRAVAHLKATRAQLLTSPPFHLSPTWWEKGLGLFQMLPLVLTAFRNEPRPSRKYSIGQYLLFDRICYETIGGHTALKASLTEDIDLGRAVVETGHKLVVYEDASLYSVRMFEDFESFTRGWSRLLRLGMAKSNVVSVVELLLVIQLFVGPNSAPGAALKVAAVGFLIYRQRHFGDFSFIGAIFYPFSLALFTGLSVAALVARVSGAPVVWRERAYAADFGAKERGNRG
jgi:4,4'-diaponeurosporenoate glycosyltransferase